MSERPVNSLKHALTKTFASIVATCGVALAAVPANAQAGAAADDPQTQQHAMENLTLLFAALNSEELDGQVKNVLAGCLYNNSLREITVAMDKAIAANPEQFDRSDQGDMLGVMAGVCGLQPPGEAGQQPAQPR
jgi:hypothetical protein